VRGLWLARGHGMQPPFAGGLAKSTENAHARASSSGGRPVVIIPGGDAATAVVLTGPLPPIECRRCAVAARCLAYALQTRQAGIWGGTTQEERRATTERHRRHVSTAPAARETARAGARSATEEPRS
jgi:WhiB family transcriptional regulator, redox-sensing transcriptional regulator